MSSYYKSGLCMYYLFCTKPNSYITYFPSIFTSNINDDTDNFNVIVKVLCRSKRVPRHYKCMIT